MGKQTDAQRHQVEGVASTWMSSFRPLSRRGHPDPEFDEPQEGVPDYLIPAVVTWFNDVIVRTPTAAKEIDLLHLLELRLHAAFDWTSGVGSAKSYLLNRVVADREFALDALDAMLAMLNQYDPLPNMSAAKLSAHLDAAGSIWRVAEVPGKTAWRLERRTQGPVLEAISSVASASERAHHHLTDAWRRLAGRSPDASGAYREAVRAVEAAAKPVVLPDDRLATLGRINGTIRSDPSKWTFVLGDPLDVARMGALLWTAQLDRHGTDDGSVPLNVSVPEADAALHIALTLVRIYAGGLLTSA